MKVTTERPEEGVRALQIELPAATFDHALDTAWRRLGKEVNIPGFRRGRAPRVIVERHVGAAMIEREALRFLLPQVYQDAVAEAQIEPIDEPDFDIVEMGRGKRLVFRATVPIRPQVELGNYRDIRRPFQAPEVTSEQVDRVLARLQEGQATWAEAPGRAAELGDQVVADVHVDWPDGRESDDRDLQIILGGNSYPEGFDDHIVGRTEGDEQDFSLTWTVERPGADAEERTAHYRVRVKAIWARQLPALDDEFARTVGAHESLDALRATVEEAVTREAEREAQSAYESDVLAAVVEETTYEVPARLVDAEARQLGAEREEALLAQGLTLERYLELTNRPAAQWRSEIREAAERRLRGRLVLDAIAAQEQLAVSDSEVSAEVAAQLAQVASGEDREARQVRAYLNSAEGRSRVRASLRRRRALDWLIRNARGEFDANGANGSEQEAATGANEARPEPAEAPPADETNESTDMAPEETEPPTETR